MIVWGVTPPANGILGAGLITSEGALTVATPAQPNDVFVQSTGAQHRWTGTIWVQVPANENRADYIILGGLANQRVAKLGTQAFRTEWASAASGTVQLWNQITAADVWTINHGLTATFVGVEVITPGYSVLVPDQGRIEQPSGTVVLGEQTILIPDVSYSGANILTLRFVDSVAGTAVVRR